MAIGQQIRARAYLDQALQLLWDDCNDRERDVQFFKGYKPFGQRGKARAKVSTNCTGRMSKGRGLTEVHNSSTESPSSARLRMAGLVMRKLTKCDA